MSSEDLKLDESPESVSLFSAINRFGFNVYRELAKEKANMFFSPVYLSTALSFLFCGSSNDTAAELSDVLGYKSAGLSKEAVLNCFKLSPAAFAKTQESSSMYRVNVFLTLNKFDVKKDFKKLAKEVFGAKVITLDSAPAPTKCIEEVDEHVFYRTQGKLENIFYSADADTVMAIISAVYFDGLRVQAFEARKTYMQQFKHTNIGRGSGMGMMMMHMQEEFLFFEEETFKALDMPYADDNLSMLFLLPRQINGLAELEQKVDSDFIEDLKTKLEYQLVDITLPKFDLLFKKKLKADCIRLGLKGIFAPGAQFSDISDSEELLIDDIFITARLPMNELGDVQAAPSYFDMSNDSFDKDNASFVADHPFMFLIYNTESGLIFFMGKFEY